MANIIEAKAIISGVDRTGAAFDSAAARMRQLDAAAARMGKSAAAGIDAAARAADRLGAVTGFRQASRDLDAASLAMRAAEQNLRRLQTGAPAAAGGFAAWSRAVDQARVSTDGAGRAAGATAQEIARAARAAERARDAFRAKGEALRQAQGALAAAGVPTRALAAEQAKLAAGANAAAGALERQAKAGQAIKATTPRPGAVAGPSPVQAAQSAALDIAAGVGAGAAVKRTYEQSRDQIVEFDRETRRQREVLDLSARGQELFQQQAMRLGYETRFSNADFIRGQMTIAQGLPKDLQRIDDGGVVRALVEETRFLAEALDKTKDPVSVDMAAELLRARINAGGYDISTPESARASARRASNEMVELSKISGMDYNDLKGYTKFGEATGKIAGMDQSFMDAAVASLRRVGFEGSMGGNFIRALGMRLSAPNRNTLDAINAAGLRYQDYQKAGTDFSTTGFADTLRRRFGREMDPATVAAIERVFQDESATGDQGRFIEQITGALIDGGFAKRNKKGEVNAQDRERIAKAAEAFYRMNVEGVDIQRLITDLLFSGKITPALARFLGGQEHGGRLLNLKPDTLQADMKTMENVPQDRAERIARETNAGVGGDYLRMLGAIETVFLRIGQALEGPFSTAFRAIDTVATAIAGLPDRVLQFGAAVGVAGAALTGLAAFLATRGLIAGAVGAGAAAASGGSAVAGGVAAAAGATRAGAGLVARGFMGLGYAGAAFAGYEAGRALSAGALELGAIAGGRHYTPATPEAQEDLRQQLAEVRAAMDRATAALHPSRRGEPNADLDRLRGREADLTNRLRSAGAPEINPTAFDAPGRRMVMPAAAQPAVDPSALTAAEASATATGAKIKDALSVTATPQLDVSQAEAAIDRLLAKLAQAGSLSRGLAASAQAGAGSVFADYGVTE